MTLAGEKLYEANLRVAQLEHQLAESKQQLAAANAQAAAMREAIVEFSCVKTCGIENTMHVMDYDWCWYRCVFCDASTKPTKDEPDARELEHNADCVTLAMNTAGQSLLDELAALRESLRLTNSAAMEQAEILAGYRWLFAQRDKRICLSWDGPWGKQGVIYRVLQDDVTDIGTGIMWSSADTPEAAIAAARKAMEKKHEPRFRGLDEAAAMQAHRQAGGSH